MKSLDLFKKKNKSIRGLNLVPLINVIFLLLIFFMLSGTIIKKDLLKISPPISKNSKSDINKKIKITINSNNKIFINDLKVEYDELSNYLVSKYPNIRSETVLIRADGKSSSYFLVNLIDNLKELEIYDIFLLTKVIRK